MLLVFIVLAILYIVLRFANGAIKIFFPNIGDILTEKRETITIAKQDTTFRKVTSPRQVGRAAGGVPQKRALSPIKQKGSDHSLNLRGLGKDESKKLRELSKVWHASLRELKKSYGFDKQTIGEAYREYHRALITGSECALYDQLEIAAAYMRYYHLRHCGMTYQIFTKVIECLHSLRKEKIYVYDVGAGTGAALVGLNMALRNRNHFSEVLFDFAETSTQMTEMGKYFMRSLQESFSDQGIVKSQQSPNSSFNSSKLPQDCIKIVSAFHLTLPYNTQEPTEYHDQAIKKLRRVLSEIKPSICLFTVNINKVKSLRMAVPAYLDQKDDRMRVGKCTVPQCTVPGVRFTDLSGKPIFKTPTSAQFLWSINKEI